MKASQAVFIVGYPRSGTQLLRGLLNNHPDISLGHEGYFIPNLIYRFGLGADVSQPTLWPEIFARFKATLFYEYQCREGIIFSEAAFVSALEQKHHENGKVAWSDIFEVLLRPYGPRPQARVFGDKSHGYINHIPLIRSIFDDVRFLFIVRDPRDQALSVSKTWGRNPLRSAQGWAAMAATAEAYGLHTSSDTITVRYEDLTADPLAELTRVCKFLEMPVTPDIAILKGKVSKRSPKDIVSQSAKYKRAFSPKAVRALSEITLPYLSRYGYPDEGATNHRKLGRLRLQWLKYSDAVASMRYFAREKGVLEGFRYYRRRHFDQGHRKQI